MTINAAWHERHPMPKNPTLEERIGWHLEHQKKCACRPMPPKLRERMRARSRRPRAPVPLKPGPEVTYYQLYIGTAAPYNFNGLVRHYYLRQGPSVAEVQVSLRPKDDRSTQSHAIARRIRPTVAAIAARHGARVAVAEVPPGPPVLQTLVAEVYGPETAARQRA